MGSSPVVLLQASVIYFQNDFVYLFHLGQDGAKAKAILRQNNSIQVVSSLSGLGSTMDA